jgi:multicomponent Na+:H+ antiporter subunit G
MEQLVHVIAGILLGAGAILSIIGAVGILRLPDVFSRMHAAGIIDTAGAGLILSGLMVEAGFTLLSVKLAIIFIFMLYTSPTTTFALARAALNGGQRPLVEEEQEPSKT